MLQDPDRFEEDAIEVVAQSEAEAQRKGEQLAELRGDADTIVICVSCIRRTRTTGKYVCTLRIESRSMPKGENS